ncbi:hypothetical protein M0R19_06080 [Candidatus Pacearchaeota archaeon]|jgi:hypothetical protein|nr:hypothetical protein [Candidatus Pacearchaeota archaeon]
MDALERLANRSVWLNETGYKLVDSCRKCKYHKIDFIENVTERKYFFICARNENYSPMVNENAICKYFKKE